MKIRTSGGVDSRSQKLENSRDQSFSSKNEQDRLYATSCSSRDPRSSSYSDREDGPGDDKLKSFLAQGQLHHTQFFSLTKNIEEIMRYEISCLLKM
jgi:hypothetical protein